MNEKTYKVMNSSGGLNIALGVLILLFGIIVGVITIVNGARLLKNKSDLIF